MGFSTVIKDMFNDDTSKNATTANGGSNSRLNDSTTTARDYRQGVKPDSAQQTSGNHLRAGTGPGTTGKPAPPGAQDGARADYDESRKVNNVAGMHAADSKLASNAEAGDERGNRNIGRGTGTDSLASNGDRNAVIAQDVDRRETRNESDLARNSKIVPARHAFGHEDAASELTKPTGRVHEDSKHLAAVVHENARHIETEEVSHVKDHERHVHHVQHHVQPVKHVEEREEVHHENAVPTAHIHENHGSTHADVHAMNGLLGQHKDTISHVPKERHVIDHGETVRENVQHHVHHVVQPVIEKETIDRHRIHTVIPTHHVTHEAPIVHQSHHHEPMTMEQFTKLGHASEGLSHSDVTKTLLNQGECTREVNALGNNMSENLRMEDGRNATSPSMPLNSNPGGGRPVMSQHTRKNDVEQRNENPVTDRSVRDGQAVGAKHLGGSMDKQYGNNRIGDAV